MKTVLLAWELGSNLGHVGPLLRLAREFRNRGLRPVFALRDVVGPYPLLKDADIPVLQAPVWPKPEWLRGREFKASSYADILAVFGFAAPEELAAVVRAWDELLALVKPDLIVADHSPALCLAAYGAIPVAITGNGYTVPPVQNPAFPAFYPKRPGMVSEARLLANVQSLQRRRRRAAPATLPALFDSPVRCVATCPELDPYRSVRRESVQGPLEEMPPHAPPPPEPRVFAYLGEEHPAIEAVIQTLAELSYGVEVYLRGDMGLFRRLLAERGARVHEDPPALTEVVPRASVVVSHAGSTTAHAALMGGRPQVLLPLHVEADLTADALVYMEVGVRLPIGAAKTEIATAISQAMSSVIVSNATARARTVSRRPHADALGEVVDGCLRLLS